MESISKKSKEFIQKKIIKSCLKDYKLYKKNNDIDLMEQEKLFIKRTILIDEEEKEKLLDNLGY